MDRNSVSWSGFLAALPTPFDVDGALNLDNLRAVIDYYLEIGSHGLVMNGSSGEWYAQNPAERKAVAQASAKRVDGAVPLIIGTTSISPADTLDLNDHAAEVGASGVMFSPPPGWRLDEREVFAFYEHVAGQARIPVMLYNTPSDVSTNLGPEMIARLAELPMVVAVKENTLSEPALYETVKAAGSKIRVFGSLLSRQGLGTIEHGLGGDGYIGGTFGKEYVAIVDAIAAGRIDEAVAVIDMVADIQKSINVSDGNGVWAGIPGQLKESLRLEGVPSGLPRFPRLGISPGSEAATDFRNALVERGWAPSRHNAEMAV